MNYVVMINNYFGYLTMTFLQCLQNCYIIIRQKGKPLFQAKDKAICMYIFTVNCDHFDY